MCRDPRSHHTTYTTHATSVLQERLIGSTWQNTVVYGQVTRVSVYFTICSYYNVCNTDLFNEIIVHLQYSCLMCGHATIICFVSLAVNKNLAGV